MIGELTRDDFSCSPHVIYKLDVNTYMSEPYITADYGSYNGMNGNNINDVYVDEEDRIWLANYPTGITIRNNRYGSYDLI